MKGKKVLLPLSRGGGGFKALEAGPLRKELSFAASPSHYEIVITQHPLPILLPLIFKMMLPQKIISPSPRGGGNGKCIETL